MTDEALLKIHSTSPRYSAILSWGAHSWSGSRYIIRCCEQASRKAVDTDLLSLLERRRVPPKLAAWVRENETGIFLSVVSFAELQFGLNQAPAAHHAALAAWLDQSRRKFAPATEELTEAVLVRWKELLADLKRKNRTMTCDDSLIAATALFHGHTLATHNRRHFEPAGVQIVDPLA